MSKELVYWRQNFEVKVEKMSLASLKSLIRGKIPKEVKVEEENFTGKMLKRVYDVNVWSNDFGQITKIIKYEWVPAWGYCWDEVAVEIEVDEK
jgi:hypothetical protein